MVETQTVSYTHLDVYKRQVQNGKCVDTTMGLTPLEGVVMGTRSGSIDPAIVEYIAKKENLDLAGVMNVLNSIYALFSHVC